LAIFPTGTASQQRIRTLVIRYIIKHSYRKYRRALVVVKWRKLFSTGLIGTKQLGWNIRIIDVNKQKKKS